MPQNVSLDPKEIEVDIMRSAFAHPIQDPSTYVTYEGTEFQVLASYRRAFSHHDIYQSKQSGLFAMDVWDGDMGRVWDGTKAPSMGCHGSLTELIAAVALDYSRAWARAQARYEQMPDYPQTES